MTQHRSTTITARGACELAGVSYRQLDYAVRTGRLDHDVPARGSGSRRAFSRRDVLRLRGARIVAECLGQGLPQALEALPSDADLEGMVEIPLGGRATVAIDLHLDSQELKQLASA